MKRFKNILLVHNGGKSGESTIARAIELATDNRANLKVIQVINQLPNDYRMLITSITPEEIMKLVVKEHIRHLENYIAPFPDSSRIQLKVVPGREFVEIIKEVLRYDHDLVIKTARGMGGALDTLFGSTAMRLLRKCPCPLWLIKPGQGQGFRRIVAAVDVKSSEINENGLNNKIMELAISLAQTEKSELHIVHTWEKPDKSLLTSSLNYSPHNINSLTLEKGDMHNRWMNDFLGGQDLGHIQHHKHVLQGRADTVIPAFAEQNQIDLIVMGTVCRTGIPGFFIGNTAEKILHRIDCSVLTVKPDDFISPVHIKGE